MSGILTFKFIRVEKNPLTSLCCDWWMVWRMLKKRKLRFVKFMVEDNLQIYFSAWFKVKQNLIKMIYRTIIFIIQPSSPHKGLAPQKLFSFLFLMILRRNKLQNSHKIDWVFKTSKHIMEDLISKEIDSA